MRLTLDASALIAFLQGEPGGALVSDAIDDPPNTCYVHAVNACEVYYDFARTEGYTKAQEVVADLAAIGLTIRTDMDTEFWQEAGGYKANLRRISLADCFCVALTRRLDAEMLTADRHEFDAIAERGVCGIRFIR